MARSSSIGRKLSWLSILTSAVALLAASLVLLLFQLQEVRSSLVRQLGSVADLLAFTSAAAVDFNDAEAARTMLTSFKTRPEVNVAGIVVNGRIFALYASDPQVAVPDDFLRIQNGYRFTDRDVTVFRPVVAEGRPLGTLFIQTSLRDVDRTFWRFAAVTGIVAIPALLIAAHLATAAAIDLRTNSHPRFSGCGGV